MGSIRNSLVWSVPVAPDVLAAHLNAYGQLHRNEIKALRLCQRFGQGDKAAVNRLPVEILVRIEDYLFENMSQSLLKDCAREFKCWEGRCKPHDHLRPCDMRKGMLEDYGMYVCKHCSQEVYDIHDVCDVHPNRRHGLSDGDMDALDERMMQGFRAWDDEQWIEEHEEGADSWESTASGWSASETGIFCRNNDILRHDFGLEVWHTHTQETLPLGDRNRYYRMTDISHSTLTYLVLPHGDANTILHEVPHGDDLSASDRPWATHEDGDATEVILPNPISDKNIAAFKKAFQMLNLVAPHEPEKHARAVYASEKDKSRHGEMKKVNASTAEPWMPKLRLLVSTSLRDG